MPSQEKIRVLVVDDIAETRDIIRRQLQFDQLIEVVGLAGSGHEAIELSQQTKPDVILMDINMPDMDGIAATEAIRKKIPYIQIVILSVQNDSSYMRRAMLAGARDFLAKPPSTDELTKAIRQAGAVAKEEQSKAPIYPGVPGNVPLNNNPASVTLGKVIVVYSPKGGTGCTTVATNLSIALQSSETKTILIDASLQFGDVAVFLNQQVKNDILNLTSHADELERELVEDVVITHGASGLHILAAPLQPENANKVSAEEFTKLLQFLTKIYTFIVVDTSSYLNEVVLSSLEKADLIVLVTTQDLPSIKSANSFLNLADASEIKRDQILFVMNRFDKRITISPEKVGESLRQPVLIIIPLDETGQLNTSIIRGIPLVQDKRANPVSRSIINLADLVRERLAKLENVQEPILRR
ncbi:MAG: response regulator [Anaerolineaceae bacterium]|jgi:pilus assembly protein CpaE